MGINLPIEENTFSYVNMYKRYGRADFSDRDLELFRCMFDGKTWFHDDKSSLNGKLIHGLSPRQHQVILCLLDGFSTDQIASQLSVTSNTAKEHVSKIYKLFEVKSFSELMSKFIH